ncbi:MAG: carbohydrate kinase family protein [Planctomycetota bacterium]|nr:carbohydrate kinase family protein [Planctomycetota bacterium]
MSVDVLCVGIVVVDAVGAYVDEWPREGSMLLFDRVEQHIGGCPANTALGLARLGIRTGLVAKVADDGPGAFVKETMRRHGVDIRGFVTAKDPRESTSFSFIMVPSSGDRRIYHTLGCNGTFAPADVATRLFKGPKWVAFEGLSLMPRLFGRNLAKLLKAARKAGARTAGDTALNSKLADWGPVFEGCWEHFDVFFPSEEEAHRITGPRKPREVCRWFRERGVKIAGVKLGAKGCALETDDGYVELPAYKVKCVDTLGAGDAFMAGFLAGMLKGLHPVEAARLGNATSAHCVQALGATTGIPRLEKVRRFMKSARTR